MKARIVLIAGVLLVLLSVGWGYVLPSGMFWDDQRAVEFNDLSVELHETMHEHEEEDHDHFGETEEEEHPEVIAAAKKYREAQTKLDNATFWTNSMPAYLRWTGLLACVVGVTLYSAGRSGSE